MSSTAAHTFVLLVPPHIQSVQLLGSWDNYARRYQMAPSTSSAPGTWCINLKFPDTSASGSSKRYWYYFILDGYFESHDPNQPTCKEPTRGITLNILNVIRSGASSPVSPHSPQSSGRHRISEPKYVGGTQMHHGVPPPATHQPHLSIVCPKPRNPVQAHMLTIDTNYHRPYTMHQSSAESSPRSSNNSSPGSAYSSYPSSDAESPITPIDTSDYPYDCGFESDSSHEEYTHAVRPQGKYAFPPAPHKSSKSRRHAVVYGGGELVDAMGRLMVG